MKTKPQNSTTKEKRKKKKLALHPSLFLNALGGGAARVEYIGPLLLRPPHDVLLFFDVAPRGKAAEAAQQHRIESDGDGPIGVNFFNFDDGDSNPLPRARVVSFAFREIQRIAQVSRSCVLCSGRV